MMLQKSQRLSQDLYEAMRCRGFTGEYHVYDEGKRRSLSPATGVLLLMLLSYVYLFARLEGVLS